MTIGGGQTNMKHANMKLNEYEQKRLMRIQDNKSMMESLGIKRIASSLTSLVDSTKEKRRKGKCKDLIDDDDDDDDDDKEYVPPDDSMEDQLEKEATLMVSKKVFT